MPAPTALSLLCKGAIYTQLDDELYGKAQNNQREVLKCILM